MLKSLITTSCSILLPFLWKAQGYSKFQIGLALFFFLFLGGIGSLLSPKFEKKIGTANVFYISMITTFPMMILFMLTYKILPELSFVIFALMGFITMFATPITMSMAQQVLPQYKSIIGGFGYSCNCNVNYRIHCTSYKHSSSTDYYRCNTCTLFCSCKISFYSKKLSY